MNNNYRIIVWGSAIAAAIAAAMASPPILAAPPAPDVRIFVNDSCLIADEPIVAPSLTGSKALAWPGLIVGSTGQAILSGVVSGVASMIGTRSQSREFEFVADTEVYLYNVDYRVSPDPTLAPEVGCLTVVAGEFAADGTDCRAAYEPPETRASDVDAAELKQLLADRDPENVLRRGNVCLIGAPSLVFESRIELSEDQTAFRLRSAGYQVNSLLSTSRKDDKRAVLHAVTLLGPSNDGRGAHLATAWHSFGEIGVGRYYPDAAEPVLSNWVRLPSLTTSASGAYQDDSEPYRTARSEVESLQRSMLRTSRQIASLKATLEQADGDLEPGLRREIERLNVRLAVDQAALESWAAEYDDLPKWERRYMPVTFRVTLTEGKSEARMMRWLANTLDNNSGNIADDLAKIISEQ